MKDEPLWYKSAIFYQLHVKCFFDSNGDGIGDFRGLKSKLDYIQNLGCTALWLQPFYPSPLKDDGYDISNYSEIHPDYGTLSDFKDFLKEAHLRNLRVVTELVINHTSDQHQWFQRARRSPPDSVYHNYYMWSDSPDKFSDARIIFKDIETSNWAWDSVAKRYYWHRFYSHQPDLNYDCPQVHKEIFKLVDFWMSMGIDGMRLDAVPYLYAREGTDCENLPETHAFLKKLRKYVDEKYPNRMLLAEANQWPEDAEKYFGHDDECHMAFHFPVMPRLFMALKMEERYPIIDIMDQTPQPPPKGRWAMFLRNHDELTLEMVTDEERDYMWRVYAGDPKARINLGIRRRLAPLLDNDVAKIELMNILLFSLPGSPIIYYGDEIGMGDNYYLGDRNGVRTPMQWSNDRNAGFSDANPQMLYLPLVIDPEYHHAYLNVENQERTVSSLLWWMRNAISVRQQSLALGLGSLVFLRPSNPKVLVLLRETDEEAVLVVANLSRYAQQVELNLKNYIGHTPVDLFSQNRFVPITGELYTITVGRYGYYWLKLEKAPGKVKEINTADLPKLSVLKKWNELLEGTCSKKLMNLAIKPYLHRSRWYRSKARTMTDIRVEESVRIGNFELLLFSVNFSDGLTETYHLPLGVTENRALMDKYPQAFISEVAGLEKPQYLIDAVYDEVFRNELFRLASKGKKLKGIKGFFKGFLMNGWKTLFEREKQMITSHVLSVEQTNTSLIFADKVLLKIYRQLDEGENVEVTLIRYLSKDKTSRLVPPYMGEISYQKSKKEHGTLALLQEYIVNSGDLWTLTLDTIRRYFEEILSRDVEFSDMWYLEMLESLAGKTAQMHLALAEAEEDALRPEPFTIHYQKSLFQAMMNQFRRNFSLLKRESGQLDPMTKVHAEKLIELSPKIVSLFNSFMDNKFAISKIRIHGDYHLGQILHSQDELIIVDFEGEPATPLSQRRLKRVALQDVAGMIRSFHYAAQTVLESYAEPQAKKLEPVAEKWLHQVQTRFLDHYFGLLEEQNCSLVPQEIGKRDLLLKTLVMNKGIYELGYELQNRPKWVKIPIKGMIKLLEDEGGR